MDLKISSVFSLKRNTCEHFITSIARIFTKHKFYVLTGRDLKISYLAWKKHTEKLGRIPALVIALSLNVEHKHIVTFEGFNFTTCQRKELD